MIDSVAVLRDVSGRICVLLFDGDGRPFSLAPLSDRVAADLRDGLGKILDGDHG